MANKAKPKSKKGKKAPAVAHRPSRRFVKLRALFAKPGVALSIDQIATALGNQKHSARAAISVLGNPAKTDDSLRISLDRETGKYSVDPTQVEGVGLSSKKESKKKAAPKGGGANGPRLAVA